MKVKLMAILMLVALSCQKEKIPEQQTVKNDEATALSASDALVNDPDFVKLYKISSPVLNALPKKKVDLKELYDDHKISYKECRTLAPKLGFEDSAALVHYIQQVGVLAPKIAKDHPWMTLKQAQDAIASLNRNSLYADPCKDAVIGQFIMNVTQCAALALIPLVGEPLAGTCMVGALASYNSGMQACVDIKAP